MNNYLSKITEEEIKMLPLKHFEGDVHVVESYESFERVINIIEKSKILGFDTETKPTFKKRINNNVSLVQLSTADKVFLIRLNKTGLPGRLTRVLGNDNIIKVGVAIKDDIKALQKLNNFIPKGFIELQDYVKDFGIENNGLKKLAAIVLNFRISKNQQTSNWDNDVLTDSQIRYAATDAWVCYKIYQKLNHII